MSRRKGSKPEKVEPDVGPLTSNPFAALGLGNLPDAPTADEPAGPSAAPSAAPPAAPPALDPTHGDLAGRLVVRRQKKGQGGKTVTCVEGLPAARAVELLPRIKRSLGCSGRMDGSTLVVGTGDHARVAAWLGDEGATKVVLGN